MTKNAEEELSRELAAVGERTGAARVAVAFHDYATGAHFSFRGDEWFHAASTIKLAVLLGTFVAVESGGIGLDARVHVRNRFVGVVDGRAFRVEPARDAGAEVHAQIGKTLHVHELARQMIVTSSNLATNLLVDLIGIESLAATLERLGIEGVELRRGVEDEAAFAASINNRVTAAGLVRLLRLIPDGALAEESRGSMLAILHDQEFRSGIPAGLPSDARVAHKTGEISTVAHDAGLVFLPDREAYAIAILTEWDADSSAGRREALASLSRAVYQHLTRGSDA
jgi:beta-lactamase class A